MTRPVVLTALLACGGLSVAIAGPQDSKVVRIQTLNVSDNLYLLSGGGGNSLALALDTGVVLIDTKLAGWSRPVLDALANVTDKPVVTLVNTHSHGDHNGGNAELTTALEIVAHENTRSNMEKLDAFRGNNARFLPNKSFEDKLSLLDGIDRMDLYYFGAAHTNGDIVVVFPAKRVAHMGDLFPSKEAPVIDTANGGSGVAYPETLAKAVAALQGVARVVTGHGSAPAGSPARGLPTVADLRDFAEFTRDFLEAVKAARASGQTASQAAAALRLPDRYKDYGLQRAAANVAAIYAELEK